MVEIPDELKIKETEIAEDLILIEDQAFVNSVDKRIKYTIISWMVTKKNLTNHKLIASLDKIIHHYKSDLNITWLYLNHTFKSLKTWGEKKWNLNIKLVAPDKQVQESKQNNRTIQDRAWV